MLQLLILGGGEAWYFNGYVIFDGGVYLPGHHARIRNTGPVKYIQVNHHLGINVIQENLAGIPVGKNLHVSPDSHGHLVVLEAYYTTVTQPNPLAPFKIQAQIIADGFGGFICLQSILMASSHGHNSYLHSGSGTKIRDGFSGPVPTNV